MNTQFRKGIIEMCVLALIAEQDMYGYEIVQSIASYTDINEGTVMAGQIAGMITREQSCEEIIREMMEQAEHLLNRS